MNRCLLLGLLGSASLALAEDVPAWVTGEKEPIKIKRSATPSYLAITETATILRPKALTAIESLEKLNPGLTKTLPGLSDLLSRATISPRFKRLYDAKISAVAGGEPLPENYFFDCATALDLRDAKSGRRAFLFQADMDTDTDGSDPQRMSALTDYADARHSRSYQPLLAYSWNKASGDKATSPFLRYFDDTLERLRGLQKQLGSFSASDPSPLWESIKEQVDEQTSTLAKRSKYYHDDLVYRRSLIASIDPFIVIPQSWAGDGIKVGDYAAVIQAGHVYPCIIGDTGPDTQAGEASQRLCRALNPKASGRVSAVTGPGVTYVIFPGTAGPMTLPDFALWNSRLEHLLGEIGGTGADTVRHQWK
jgi:hypothetical protein